MLLYEGIEDVIKMDFEIAVIGGGPAGLTAAVYAARAGHAVTILEALHAAARCCWLMKLKTIPDFLRLQDMRWRIR